MDAYRRALLNSFTVSALDRCAERRGDDDWLAARKLNPSSLFVMVRDGDCLIKYRGDGGRARLTMRGRDGMVHGHGDSHAAPVFLSCRELGDDALADPIFLGCLNDDAVFAIDVGDDGAGDGELDNAKPAGEFTDLRIAAPRLSAEHASLLAYAKTLAHWRRAHRSCPACAAPLRSDAGGHVLRCDGCARAQFPRTDPAVIVLVEHAGACLLARQAGWEAGRYSVLAGFVEPGESAEQTVRREVFEEAGVTVTAMRYHASQPWPFPGALMLGYFAQAIDARIKVDGDELEHAQWFTRAELTRALQQNQLRISPAISISHRLIEHWFDAKSDTPLREVLASCG